MRKAMQAAVREMLLQHEKTALLLIDIGAFPFRDLLKQFPDRAKNIGIFEPGTISVAAGLALSGITPTVYGISPFIAQRSLEQLKLDFVYQQVGGNFITTGAAYDFSTLGYSHYCPEDVATLRLLPGMEILAPGTPEQFTTLFRTCCLNGKPSYFRMTDHCSALNVDVSFGEAALLKKGSKATVVTSAEAVDVTMAACADRDVTVLYYTTMAPFDGETLRKNFEGGKVFISTPYYVGSLTADIMEALSGASVQIGEAGVPLEVLRSYGTKKEKDCYLGLTGSEIQKRLDLLIGVS